MGTFRMAVEMIGILRVPKIVQSSVPGLKQLPRYYGICTFYSGIRYIKVFRYILQNFAMPATLVQNKEDSGISRSGITKFDCNKKHKEGIFKSKGNFKLEGQFWSSTNSRALATL
jgi:hypothetical protein